MASVGDSGSLSPLLPVTRIKEGGQRKKPQAKKENKKRQEQPDDANNESEQQPDKDEPKTSPNKIDDYA